CLVALLCLLVSFFFCMLCRPLASTLFPYTTLFRSGGAMFFFGPVIGSVIFILFAVALSEYTPAWQFYLGIFFVLMVMYAPGGVVSILLLNLRVAREGLFRALRKPYLKLVGGSLGLLAGVVLLVEMTYGLTLSLGTGTMVKLFGIEFDAAAPMPWIIAA